MNVKATCKFCQKPLELEIDNQYATLGDPYKLLRYAACNRCADLKEKQRRLRDQLSDVVVRLLAKHSPESHIALVKTLETLLKEYLRFVCEWLKTDQLEYDVALTDSAAAFPSKISDVLGRMWIAAKHTRATPELALT